MFGDIDKVNEQIAARKLKEYNQNCSDQRDYLDEWDLNYIHFFLLENPEYFMITILDIY